ncbi:indolepyruvate ferredoxin oxidoreductase subunit alpha [Aminithiophilus ramosus]|uniref:Indolepyruvate oxidoreductase subunit IorA n=1 Tax=Aminithiophilus ramosus TaxID=3029084 RepID=A0A9Q7EUG7_9BACT|nr:indolepyruvate ferredoxin oxidoreductase subunit alpha [Aminithiophilus ramosus]QTX31688.1 indolepyruvate ferredoxin oxidoreductase subunit alpha [Aminithiophilus ramosus]
MSKRQILLGNEAIARGIVEAGCAVATAYPGTPSSEILPAVAVYADELGTKTAVEWGINEKVAFEVAAAASFAGQRACAVMKQVGLNVAADGVMSVAQFRMAGGFLLVVADDPGPHSSQTEQDSRFFAMFAKLPCFDPSSADEAKRMVFDAFDLSERHGIIAVLRPSVRVDHCRQDVEMGDVLAVPNRAAFKKDPKRWVCLPANVRVSHPQLNAKIDAIQEEFEGGFEAYNYEVPAAEKAKLAVVAGGVSFSIVMDILKAAGRSDVAVLKIGTPFPLPLKKVQDFIDRHENVLFLEETYPVMEMQLPDRTKVKGRWNGFVPRAGELLPEVIEEILFRALGEEPPCSDATVLKEALAELKVTPRPPALCPGCPHRASYFSIHKALPGAIYPSDIGCYTLGVNQKMVDSVVCMGASVSQGSGFFLAHHVDGKEQPVVATIGDSTFFHMGIPGLINAVYNRHAFVLALLDNSLTAMTGGQSHPGIGDKLRKEEKGVAVDMIPLIKGCGVEHVTVVPAYDVARGTEAVREAWQFARENRTPAVVVFRHPCMLLKPRQETIAVTVDAAKCIGCRYCITNFNCPGLVFDDETKKARIDERFCVSCGVCRFVCPHGAIIAVGGEEA